jgi:flagellar biosynthesis/type III secretory pathway M-ring protein FliF/YscJ
MTDLINAAIGLVVVCVVGWIVLRNVRKAERERIEQDAKDEAARRVVEGRKRMLDGRDMPPDERLRRNDGSW